MIYLGSPFFKPRVNHVAKQKKNKNKRNDSLSYLPVPIEKWYKP